MDGGALVTGQRLDRDRPVDPGDAAQLLPHHRRLQLTLGRQRRVLPVAAATATRARIRAGRLDPVSRRLQDLDGVSAGETGGYFRDPGPHPLTGQGVPDEHDRARAAQAGHAPAAVRGLTRAQLGHVPRREQIAGAGRLPRRGPGRSAEPATSPDSGAGRSPEQSMPSVIVTEVTFSDRMPFFRFDVFSSRAGRRRHNHDVAGAVACRCPGGLRRGIHTGHVSQSPP